MASSTKELQAFLRERGVVISGQRKLELAEDRTEMIEEKLRRN